MDLYLELKGDALGAARAARPDAARAAWADLRDESAPACHDA